MGILIWGVIPPIALLAYIYTLDKVEKEPVKLVAKVLLFGCLSVIPAIILEIIGEVVLSPIPAGLIYDFLMYFIVVAGAEEFSKRLAMKLAVWNNPEFDYVFDAVLYCVAAALGFALVENVEYMAMYGTGIALGRLIPVHTICGVFMGLYLGMQKLSESQGQKDKARNAAIMSLAVPMLIHGFWDFSLNTGVGFMVYAALIAIVVLTGVAFAQVHKTSQNDQRFRWGNRYPVNAPVAANMPMSQAAPSAQPTYQPQYQQNVAQPQQAPVRAAQPQQWTGQPQQMPPTQYPAQGGAAQPQQAPYPAAQPQQWAGQQPSSPAQHPSYPYQGSAGQQVPPPPANPYQQQ